MYRFLARLSPDDIEAVAAQLYVELLKHGYTAVAEFHYLHNDPAGGAYENRGELADRILAAAGATGIGLTLLPVLYQTSQFGGKAPTEGQRRFTLATDDFLAAGREAAAPSPPRPPDRASASRRIRCAQYRRSRCATRSRRSARSMRTRRFISMPPSRPRKSRIASPGAAQRPVEWLLANAGLDRRWCLVHCTHMTADETRGLASSGAVVGLCPTTEGNLGDGVFPLPAFLESGGRFGIGTDSNVATSPVEELRWLEYVQRLVARARNLTEKTVGAATGANLYRRALAGGAQALGRPIGALARGNAPTSSCSTRRTRRCSAAAATRCSTPGSSRATPTRCATSWSAGSSSCATASIRTKNRPSPTIAAPWRAWATESRASQVVTPTAIPSRCGSAPPSRAPAHIEIPCTPENA